MTESYIDFCVDIETTAGTPWCTIEGIVLVEHNQPSFADDLVCSISSYWHKTSKSYEALTEGQISMLLEKEDEISEQAYETLINTLELGPPPQPERFNHHEHFGGAV